MAVPAILGYWDIRGLGEPAKLLLEYGGANYEDRRFNMSKPDWLKYKTSLGFDFPNLPFYQDEDVKITQSKAIFKHLGRKFGLAGSTPGIQAEADMLIDVASDFTQAATSLCYRPDFSAELMQQWIQGNSVQTSLESRLKTLQDKLGENSWFVGNEMTTADFVLWEILDQHRLLFPGCLDNLPALAGFHARFKLVKGVKEYIESPRYREFPIWSVRAKYGYFKP